jgi:small-conductance mechanosensitive channel
VVHRARVHLVVLLPLMALVLLVYHFRAQLFGRELDTLVRTLTAMALVALGWQIARDVGRSLRPLLFRHLDAGTAGSVGFLVRLITLLAVVVIAVRVAGLDERLVAVGGVLTAVVLALAGQQTIANVVAGMILITARPFRVSDRVRLQGGGLAGSLEGVVSSVGLLYTTLHRGQDVIMVPNSVLVTLAVSPLREPDAVEIRARLRAGLTPHDVQSILEEHVQTPLRGPPQVAVEELQGDEIVVRVSATPDSASDGSHLATELLQVMARLTPTAEAPLPSGTPRAHAVPAPGHGPTA